jgi:hypothetical protein
MEAAVCQIRMDRITVRMMAFGIADVLCGEMFDFGLLPSYCP